MIIALPSKIFILRQKENQDIVRDREEYNIYFKNIILPYREEYDVRVECEFGGNRCFGVAANMDFILICTYEENGENPELVIYKKR